MNKLIDIIAGARPNFIKIAAVINEIERRCKTGSISFNYRLIHTGQHYDKTMSDVFFEDLNIPFPDINLATGIEQKSQQIPATISRYSEVLTESRPDMVLVSGDVNSTLACAIATKKTDPTIPLGHIEAGLRSNDRSMPEEINRILTDSISDYFFTTSRMASANLVKEQVAAEKIFFVGNTMIDTLQANIQRFRKPAVWHQYELQKGHYIVLTLHRERNIVDAERMQSIIAKVVECAAGIPVIFPVHPHTAKMMQRFGINTADMHLINPMGYLEFNYLVQHSMAVITDSGGISEEATMMHIPCLTMRNTTERPETCTDGTNVLLGDDFAHTMHEAFDRLHAGQWPAGKAPELWDGHAARRIVTILDHLLAVPGRIAPVNEAQMYALNASFN
jgi:UDP-N-acetylglucosamine 2-epimerase (non-hydrolysing)